MKPLLIALTTSCFAIVSLTAYSQKPVAGKNIIKINLTSVALKHYSLQYERTISKNKSFAIAVGVSPGVGLPFKKTLLDLFDGNADAKKAIETTKFDKITITPEYRFYTGKKEAPAGFYIAPFARYTHMSISQDYEFTPSSNELHVAHLKGKFSGIGVGVKIGAQWALGQHVALDWWIAGPFIGAMNASFHGTDDMSDMTPADKAELESDIESIDIPLWKIDATVGNNKIDAKLKGPFYGIVAGLNLGIRF
jgi:hypothetical protein